MNFVRQSAKRKTFGTPQELLLMISENLKVKDTSPQMSRNIQITDGFLCRGCIIQYEKDNLIMNNDLIQEELDIFGFDINPDMEEENKCIYCLRRKKNTEATCLFKGYPSCNNCAQKKIYSTNNLVNTEYDSFNQIENESFSNSGTIGTNEKTKINTFRRMKSDTENLNIILPKQELNRQNTFNNIITNINNTNIIPRMSVDFKSFKTNDEKKNQEKNKPYQSNQGNNSIGLNLNKIYFDKDNLEDGRSPRKSLLITEYSHKEIDNKIMNLVSPQTNFDMKFKKSNTNQRQIEKMCKSLEYIFDNSNKMSINLPIIFGGNKHDMTDSLWIEKLQENGNYLIVFLDLQNEFLFGFVCNTFANKKAGKFFKKSSYGDHESITRRLKSNSIEYFEVVLENIQISKKSIMLENSFLFDLINFKFSSESSRLSKFLLNTQSNTSLSQEISSMNIYDMC